MIDWHTTLGIAAGALPLIAIVPYIKDILHGTSRPNVASYSIWVFLLLIAILAQISAGASWSVLMIIGDLVGTSIIVILCLSGYGYGKYGLLEWVCLALAVVAIILWYLTKQPVVAILFAVIADLMAAIPTLVKSYRDAWSEVPTTYFIIAVGALCAVLSTTILNPANLIFPVYLLAVNGLTASPAFFGRRMTPNPNV